MPYISKNIYLFPNASPLFGEKEVMATRDIEPGELGPYAGVLLRDDEVLQHLGARPRYP
jgi:hypothetical protein